MNVNSCEEREGNLVGASLACASAGSALSCPLTMKLDSVCEGENVKSSVV